jgi:hypothetical protein
MSASTIEPTCDVFEIGNYHFGTKERAAEDATMASAAASAAAAADKERYESEVFQPQPQLHTTVPARPLVHLNIFSSRTLCCPMPGDGPDSPCYHDRALAQPPAFAAFKAQGDPGERRDSAAVPTAGRKAECGGG